MTTSNAQEEPPVLDHGGAMDAAFVRAYWENLDPGTRETLEHDRLRLLRWMKRLIRARTPDLGDGLATISACRVATQMFGT
jgi:hypothetical protein